MSLPHSKSALQYSAVRQYLRLHGILGFVKCRVNIHVPGIHTYMHSSVDSCSSNSTSIPLYPIEPLYISLYTPVLLELYGLYADLNRVMFFNKFQYNSNIFNSIFSSAVRMLRRFAGPGSAAAAGGRRAAGSCGRAGGVPARSPGPQVRKGPQVAKLPQD